MADIAISPAEARMSSPVRALRAAAGSAAWRVLRILVGSPAGLRLVNAVHRRLTPAARRRFYYLCYDETCRVEGRWHVDVAGRRLVLPLHRDFHLAWIAAIAFHGHDPEIHELYEGLLTGDRPPRVVFDVGASYGLHTLKFLAHGVPVVSFEPNPDCHAFLRQCGALNGLQPEIHAVAVGAEAGHVELLVPGHQTYLGSVSGPVKSAWDGRTDVTRRLVPQTTLDAFARTRGLLPDLVKIDVEGNELRVLEGARGLLNMARPTVVVESWPGGRERAMLFRRLDGHGYDLYPLVVGRSCGAPLRLEMFLTSPALNFVARPRS